jgi:hypothetical protein
MVTHGFTLSDPSLAWLIVHGHKIIENRQVRFAPGWYAVHIGATAYCHVERELKLIKEFGMPLTMSMKKGHVIGVCKIETGVPHELCKKNRWAVSDYKICNIITEFMAFDKDEEVPARGNLNSWPLKEAGPRVEYLMKQGFRLGYRKQTNAKEVLAHVFSAENAPAPAVKGKRPSEAAAKAEGEARPAIKKAKSKAGAVAKPEEATEPLTKPLTKSPADIRGFFVKKAT